MSKSEPILIDAYQTFDNKMVFLNQTELAKIIEEFGTQAKIPDTVILDAQLLVLEQNESSPVYELKASIKIYKLSLLEHNYVRCSNC